jgi:branched-chain amino acid transport system substrate-binding protein
MRNGRSETRHVISDWYTADQTVTEPIVQEASARYAADKKILPRDCSKEG